MARSSATRKGNGAGHGGAASGPGYGPSAGPAKAFTADNQPTGEAKSAGKEVAAEIKAQIAARKEEILAAQFTRALDPLHPQGHAAAKDLLDRIAPPESRTDVTTNGERLGYVIMAPAEAEDAEAWAKQHQPQA
jgi:hypothetical protein